MTFSIQDLYFGAFAGAIPTVSMMLTSIFFVKVDLSATFQASAQNLCAGETSGSQFISAIKLLSYFIKGLYWVLWQKNCFHS